jgi:hypothetical protein
MAAEAARFGLSGGRRRGAVRCRRDAIGVLPFRNFSNPVDRNRLGNHQHPDPGA